MIRLSLPIPPSVNALFANNYGRGRKGRRPTPEYTAWRWHALVALREQLVTPAEGKTPLVDGPYKLRLFLPRAMRGDISNRIKAAEDFLVAHRITSDDRHNCHVTVERSDDVALGVCIVEIDSLDRPRAVAGARREGPLRPSLSNTERTGVDA